jgi:hypothetical protein
MPTLSRGDIMRIVVLVLVIAALAIVPVAVFADWGAQSESVGYPASFGPPVDSGNPDFHLFTFCGSLQPGCVLRDWSAGIGSDEAPPARMEYGATTTADITVGPISFDPSRAMALDLGGGIDVNASLGPPLRINIIFWM